jgi:hypothetical protein
MEPCWVFLPRDIVHKILEIHRQIIFKNGKYFNVNKISFSDYRYSIIRPLVIKKSVIFDEYIKFYKNLFKFEGFFFEVSLDKFEQKYLEYERSDIFTNSLFSITYCNFEYDPPIKIITNI